MHGKISPSMYSGSMVGAGAMAFALMPYCIANARPDENCSVDLNPRVLAAVFGETKEGIESAIKYLSSPDPDSRSKDCDGRRIVHCGPGPFRYRVVNLQRYRDDVSTDQRREYWRQHKAWERAGKTGEFKFNAEAKSEECPQSESVSTVEVHATDTSAGTDAGATTSTHTQKPEARVRVDLNAILPKKQVNTTEPGALGLISELNSLYLRPEGSAWSYEEEHLAADVANRQGWQAELKLLVWYRSKLPEKRYFPNTIRALLSGWTAHLDKARLATKHKSMRYE